MRLKSRKEPCGTVPGLLGVVASQIILESPRSIGDNVIASRNRAKNASANMKSIPSDTRIASRMTGITTPGKTVMVSVTLSIHDAGEIESYDYIEGKFEREVKKVVQFFSILGYCSKVNEAHFVR